MQHYNFQSFSLHDDLISLLAFQSEKLGRPNLLPQHIEFQYIYTTE